MRVQLKIFLGTNDSARQNIGRVNIKFDIDTIGHVQLDAPIYFREEAI